MPLTEETRNRIRSLIGSSRIVLFMKGDRDAPQCGFSANVVGVLNGLVPEYETFDVLGDPEIREGIKEFSSWPTIPQLYVDGELLGGADIVNEMAATGDLHRRLGVPVPEARIPSFEISAAAADEVHRTAARMNVPQGYELRLTIDAQRRNQLGFSPVGPGDVTIESKGLKIVMDAATASRADGLGIDVVETSLGTEFRIGPRKDGGSIQQIRPAELRQLLADGVPLIDVRTPAEREIARIEGSRLLDAETVTWLESLDRDTPIAFHCHHGVRSRAAAEHFAQLGFTKLYNLAGGIDAWSVEVDANVRRY